MPFDTGWGGGCCSGVVVRRTQPTKLVNERNQGRTISMSAMKAGMSRKTAGKYLRQDKVMEQLQVTHTWRMREDPLAGTWPEALAMLRAAPELQAKALFGHLAEGRGDEIKPGLLRTFQRRVRSWRLEEGPEKEVFFTQDHKPGGTLAVDWTDMGGVGITIQSKVFAHKLFHAVLPYFSGIQGYSSWPDRTSIHWVQLPERPNSGRFPSWNRFASVLNKVILQHSAGSLRRIPRREPW
jgi:transposase